MSKENSPVNFNFIGEKSELTGNILLQGDTHIYGKVLGNISGPSDVNLTIEYTGAVEGVISGVNVYIHGQLLGNIDKAGSVEISSTAKIKGDILAKRLQIFPGAKIDGEIQSIENSSS